MSYRREDLRTNHLLGALDRVDLHVLLPYMEAMNLKPGQLLCDAGALDRYLYFPVTAVLSIVYLMEDGSTVEVAAIGNEGVAGLPSLIDGGAADGRVEARRGGSAYRIPAAVFRSVFDRSPTACQLVFAYSQAQATYIARTALCNRHHSIEQQLCRWILLNHDRARGVELSVTQQVIAGMLGVRREGVSSIAGRLQESRLIQLRRGHITVLDRHGLEARACQCYATLRRESMQLKRRIDQIATNAEPYGSRIRATTRVPLLSCEADRLKRA